jgi:hypothetical protein
MTPSTTTAHLRRRLVPTLAVSAAFAAALTPAAHAASNRPAGPPPPSAYAARPHAPTAIVPPRGLVRGDVVTARVGAL